MAVAGWVLPSARGAWAQAGLSKGFRGILEKQIAPTAKPIETSPPSSSSNAVWPVEREWNAQEEDLFSKWFQKLSSRPWGSINQALKDPEYNTLLAKGGEEFTLGADCGDLPYVVRCYYAWKRRLPFIFNLVDGNGQDLRYADHIRSATIYDNVTFPWQRLWDEFIARAPYDLPPELRTFRGPLSIFLAHIANTHSGNFRTTPECDDSFAYPVAISRATVRPGAIFYDPRGHTTMVSEVLPDGTVIFLDAHPDQTVTRSFFGPKYSIFHSSHVGGFKNYRPVNYDNQGRISWERDNSRLPNFSTEQYTWPYYHAMVRMRLQGDQAVVNPLQELEDYITNDTYQEVKDRVRAVQLGWEAGRVQAIPISDNIYAGTGEWEKYSTPGRDVRLRLSFLGIADKVRELLLASNGPQAGMDAMNSWYGQMHTQAPYWNQGAWGMNNPGWNNPGYGWARNLNPANAQALGQQLRTKIKQLLTNRSIEYINSASQPVRLTLKDIEQRLFLLSFDPNHPPELRWGATGKELETAPSDQPWYRSGYQEQQLWRNRLEYKEGLMRPDDADNPKKTPPHDLDELAAQAIREAVGGRAR